MELVNVEKWGTTLVAPELPRHALMYDVKPGDTVFHWVGKNNPLRLDPGMYGYSKVAGFLEQGIGEWLGSPANLIRLTECRKFEHPLYLESLRNYTDEILCVLEDLKCSTTQATHFPFQNHPTCGLKPNQRYLSKWPAELLEVVPELHPDKESGRW